MDTFSTLDHIEVRGKRYEIRSLPALEAAGFAVERLPWTRRILLENLLRHEDGTSVDADHIRVAATPPGAGAPRTELAFRPARVLLQDFTGVPAVVDLAAMRDLVAEFGGDPRRIQPRLPVELVIDHSIQVDAFGSPDAFRQNQELDYARNRERYELLAWARDAFANFKVVPPNTGIVHQVNLERLARVVSTSEEHQDHRGPLAAFPDTLVGTDSHTPMINGLGVLGWGVGGIEAEAALLGEPVGLVLPDTLGVRVHGRLREGVTATDLVLTVTQALRARGVVGKFVEFCGPGLDALALPDRATIGNMSPEYGATCAVFPVDSITLDYLAATGRPDERIELVERYMRAQGLFRDANTPDPLFDDTLELDLGSVETSIAGPRRPQERIELSRAAAAFREALPSLRRPGRGSTPTNGKRAQAASGPGEAPVWGEGTSASPAHHAQGATTVAGLGDGAVVLAAITSCTNTSNPRVMLAAGLLAKAARERGLETQPWVKTSLAPGSRVVRDHLDAAGLTPHLDALGFHLVGYGCTTCIGNSGPLPDDVARDIREHGLVVASVLSGNRNFENRIHSAVRANYLMSPPLVVAFAIAGRIDIDLRTEPLGVAADGTAVFLADVWPTSAEIEAAMAATLDPELFRNAYGELYTGDEAWSAISGLGGARFPWDEHSTYVRPPAFFDGFSLAEPAVETALRGARALVVLGDGVTTDHISPAGSIAVDSAAGRFLVEHGVDPEHFNSYGARRGNHEVMVRGTFANPRLSNRLVPGREGHLTQHLPSGDVLDIHAAALRYAAEGVPLIILAGADYGSGSSRDWAAKGPRLLGVRAVIARSYERIHRSNLIGMGILPFEFAPGESLESLGLDGTESFALEGLDRLAVGAITPDRRVEVTAHRADGAVRRFQVVPRIDTPQEALYLRAGGILDFVLRRILTGVEAQPPRPAPAGARAVATSPTPQPDDIDRAAAESFPASDPPAR